MQMTDAEIREMLIERKKAERAQKNRERYLAVKCWLCVGSLIGCGLMVWAGAWAVYALGV